MKTKFYTAVMIMLLCAHLVKSNAQANTSLSNLASLTKVNVSLLPDKNNNHDLGASTRSWRNIYFTGRQLMGTQRVIAIDTFLANTFIGTKAGIANGTSNTFGNSNTATGYEALYSNIKGSINTAYGYVAMYKNTTGGDNTAIGAYALAGNNESYNTAVGSTSLANTSASQYNTALGFSAGNGFDNGYNNVFVGAYADANAAGYYNVVAIGKSTLCTAPSQVRIGNSFTTSIGGNVGWTNLSDGRVKKNIKQTVPGLAFINKLQPITYNLDLDAIDKIIQRPQIKDKDGKIIQPSPDEVSSKRIKEQTLYTGFVAQDVEKAAKSLNYDFSGVDAPKNDKDLYGLRYADFVVPLVKAVQELSKMNDDKQKEIDSLKSEMAQIKSLLLNNNTENPDSFLGSSVLVRLDQNIPNPSSSSTFIKYFIPNNLKKLQLVITDASGKVTKAYPVNAGEGNQTIYTKDLSSGTYQYSIYSNGKFLATKQMTIVK